MRTKTIKNLIIMILATAIGVVAGIIFVVKLEWHEGWSLAAAGVVWLISIVGITKVIRAGDGKYTDNF